MLSFLTLRGATAGVIAGFASGLLGVTPGGILVPVISIFLPYSQHVAQGISLVAQAPPTSIAGLSAYSRRGRGARVSSVLFCLRGFHCRRSGRRFPRKVVLRTGAEVDVCRIPANSHSSCDQKEPLWAHDRTESQSVELSSFASLFLIGIVAGLSSGLLGIGGGLAIVALSVVLLHQTQHDAQVLSLAVSAFPLTLPAAWVYVRQGFKLPWLVIGGLIAGLAVGSWLGGLCASRLPEERLKQGFVALLIAMTVYNGLPRVKIRSSGLRRTQLCIWYVLRNTLLVMNAMEFPENGIFGKFPRPRMPKLPKTRLFGN